MTTHWIVPALLAFAGFGVGNAVLKHASHAGEDPPPVLVAIHLTALATALVWVLGAGLPFHRDGFLLGLGAGVVGFTGLVSLYAALQRGVAVKVFPVMRLNTLVTVGLAIAVLAERPSLVVAAGIGVAVTAMWVLSGSDANDPGVGDGPGSAGSAGIAGDAGSAGDGTDGEDRASGGPGRTGRPLRRRDLTWFWLALVTLVTFGTVNFVVDLAADTAAGRASTVVGLYLPTTLLAIGYHLFRPGRVTARSVTHGAATGAMYVLGFFGLTGGYALDTVSRVAPFMGLNILVPMGASVAFMGERVTWRVAVGTTLALLAMYLLSVG